jgi:hypothetical protein
LRGARKLKKEKKAKKSKEAESIRTNYERNKEYLQHLVL